MRRRIDLALRFCWSRNLSFHPSCAAARTPTGPLQRDLSLLAQDLLPWLRTFGRNTVQHRVPLHIPADVHVLGRAGRDVLLLRLCGVLA
jgi:hypothetical protein